MDDIRIIATFTIIADVLTALGQRDPGLAHAADSEVLLVAVIAATDFQNHHERALSVLKALHYLSGPLAISRFNRRLHCRADGLPRRAEVLGHCFEQAACLIIDRLPVPVCRRVCARRCRKVRGAEYCGYCAAKHEKFFGGRLHLACTPEGIPVRYSLLPAACHDLTPLHELLWDLPRGVWVLGDKAYNSQADERTLRRDTGVRLAPIRKANMRPNSWEEQQALEQQRHAVETLNSQAEKMGLERLYARTNAGFDIKVAASVVALVFSNMHKITDEQMGLPLAWTAAAA